MWKPSDWLKLIALVGGLLIFLVGTYMLYTGIAAEGVVDIRSSIVSGTLKTASAGLFICFFAFLLIIFVLISLIRVSSERPAAERRSRSSKLLPVFWGSLIGILISAVGATLTWGSGSTAFFYPLGFFGATLSTATFAIIRMSAEDV